MTTPDRLTEIRNALEAPDEVVGPACMNVPVPPTIATDDAFREPYSQGYRHALSDARKVVSSLRQQLAEQEQQNIGLQHAVTDATETLAAVEAKLSEARAELARLTEELREARELYEANHG